MKTGLIAALLIAGGVSGCTSLGQVPTARLATGTLHLANGIPVGTVVLTAAGDTVTVSLVAAGVPAGLHGAHLHAVGKCEGPDFVSAGPHLNPAARQHGSHNPAGAHLGDLPNLLIDSHGRGTLSADLGANRTQARAALFDADGTAVVIHAAADDYATDPSGNSGSRLACAVLKPS